MVKIELLLDESEKLSAKEPTGVCLFQNETDEVRGEYTYLDAWLICIIKGLDEIREEQTASIDVEFADQPEVLVFEKVDGLLSLRYFDSICAVGTQDEFEEALKQSISEFVGRFKEVADYSDNTFFEILEAYSERGV